MTDRAFEPTESDPFAAVFGAPAEKTSPPSVATDDDDDNPFAKVMPRPVAEPVSTFGAFGRGAARRVVRCRPSGRCRPSVPALSLAARLVLL
jgi:hypothetical protein